MNELIKRTLSGAVYVGIVVGTLCVSPQPGFNVLVAILAFLALREYHTLMQSRPSTLYMGATAGMILTIISALLAGNNLLGACWAIVAYSAIILCLLINELFNKESNPIQNWGTLLSGQIMIGLPFALMNAVCMRSQWLMLALFVVIWVNDSGAYCVGSLLAKRKGGNHKMFPRVSPGKSWEGLIGGMIMAVVAGIVFSCYVEEWSTIEWAGIALMISIAGTLGDLMESLFKRTLGIKDSGKFMPGHGGVLDRFDSILLATPVIFLILLLL